METNRVSIPVGKLIFEVQLWRTLRDSASGADFPGFQELVHWSPDTEASGPRMPCTRTVPGCHGQEPGRVGGTSAWVFENHAASLG